MTATPQPVLGLATTPAGAFGITTVKIDLITDPGQPVPALGFLPTNLAEVVGSVAVTASESTGVWGVTLYANADIEPAGSFYRATYVVDGIEHPPIYFTVGAGGGWVHENPYQPAATIPDGGTSGKLLAYTEILANVTTSTTALADLTGAAITVPVGVRPFMLEFHAPSVVTSVADKSLNLHLYAVSGPTYIASCLVGIPLTVGQPVTFRKLFATLPPAGLTDYKLQWAMGESGGTRTIQAAPAFLSAPAYLAAFEL
jgi:hypothetical protein